MKDDVFIGSSAIFVKYYLEDFEYPRTAKYAKYTKSGLESELSSREKSRFAYFACFAVEFSFLNGWRLRVVLHHDDF